MKSKIKPNKTILIASLLSVSVAAQSKGASQRPDIGEDQQSQVVVVQQEELTASEFGCGLTCGLSCGHTAA